MARRFGAFVGLRIAGRGGMGEVWEAVHRPTGLPAAVKRIRGAADDGARAAFAHEVRTLARLLHPNVVAVLDHGEDDGAPWVAMEWVPAGTARDRPPATWQALRGVLVSVLDALAHGHAHGILHRDVKPANVLHAADGTARLGDWGIAAVAGAGRRAGTPGFMAPEQGDGEGPWTDLYAVGATGWALATGRTPDDRVGRLPAFSAVMAVPDELEEWLRALLARDPDDRPATAADARAALLALPDARSTVGASPTVRVGGETVTGGDLDATVEPPARSDEPRIGPAPTPADWRPPYRSVVRAPLVLAGLRWFGLRPPPDVGRTAERDALWQALRSVRPGAPATVALVGEPGTGASHLLRWLCVRAAETGAAEVRDVGSDLGAAVRGWLGPLRRARRIALRRGVPEAPLHALLAGDRRPETVRAVAIGWIRGGDRPVLLAADPPDGETIALLGEVVALGLPVLGVVTREVRLPDVTRLALAPLPGHEVDALVREAGALSGRAAAAVAERAGGRPAVALELLGALVRSGALAPVGAAHDVDPARVVAVPVDGATRWRAEVDAALAAEPAGVGRAMVVGALLAHRPDPAEWRRASGSSSIAAAEALVRRGLAAPEGAGVALVHPAVRDALVARAAQADHLACAEAVEDPLRSGLHLCDAGQPEAALARFDPDVTPQQAGPPSATLDIGHRWSVAARTAGLPPDHPGWAWLRCVAARGALIEGGWSRLEEIERELEAADPASAPTSWALTAGPVGWFRAVRGPCSAAERWFERGLAVAPTPSVRCRLLALRARAALLAGRTGEARRWAEEALQLEVDAYLRAGILLVLVEAAVVDGDAAEARRALVPAEALVATWGWENHRYPLALQRAEVDVLEGRLDAAADGLVEAIERCRRLRLTAWQWPLPNLARVELLRGRLAEATRLTDEAVRAATASASPVRLAIAHGLRLATAAAAGDPAGVRAALDTLRTLPRVPDRRAVEVLRLGAEAVRDPALADEIRALVGRPEP